MKTNICIAIEKKKLISFVYDNVERVVEPFCYGEDKDKAEKLSAFQIKGGKISDWKFFSASGMSNIFVLGDRFKGKRNGYNKNDPRFLHVYCKI